jgi:hypothetical protein
MSAVDGWALVSTRERERGDLPRRRWVASGGVPGDGELLAGELERDGSLDSAGRRRGRLLPAAGGGASASVAAVGSCATLTATAERWWEGRHGDRHGHAWLLVSGLVATSFGMIIMMWLATLATVIADMACSGRVRDHPELHPGADDRPDARVRASQGQRCGTWSTTPPYWAGPVVFGLLVSHTGYPPRSPSPACWSSRPRQRPGGSKIRSPAGLRDLDVRNSHRDVGRFGRGTP